MVKKEKIQLFLSIQHFSDTNNIKTVKMLITKMQTQLDVTFIILCF